MKNTFIYLCGLLFVFSCTERKVQENVIIPEPLNLTFQKGEFNFSTPLSVYTNLSVEEQTYFLNYINQTSLIVERTEVEQKGNLKLLTTDAIDTDEGYRLTVTNANILVEAKSGAGIFYGLQSLFQLINSNTTKTIPCVIINDTPRFKYRGFMLDASRHFASIEFIKKHLDIMAYYKLNTFHWHLTDGAGWRLQIQKYPELTEVAAWRAIKDYKTWSEEGKPFTTKDNPTAYGGYYTQEEVKEVVQYAAERYITVIPEIEMPGHSEEVLTVYPHLSCSGEKGVNSEFCIGNEDTFVFLTDVLKEVMELFPSPYIHIGGDEAAHDAWRKCVKCQRRMKENQLNNEDELQSYLIHRIAEFLNDNGKKLIGWDEILEGGVAPNAVVMSWRGEEGGIKAVESGHEVIMTPGGYCYIDSYQDAPPFQPDAMSGYLPLNKVYQYNPVPESIKENSSLILGVQANLWREWIATDEHTEMMMYPRLLALAEVAWTAPEKKDLSSFRKRVIPAVEFLKSKGVNAYDIAHEIGDRKESFEDVTHLGLHKPVSYKNSFHKNYAADKELTLTDGKRGTWSYADGRWQAVLDLDFDVTIDLEKVIPIQSITATFMQEHHAWIWLPKEVNIYTSIDNENFELLATITHDIAIDQTGYILKDFGWEGKTEARYIRYVAQAIGREGAWLFTDEIIIN